MIVHLRRAASLLFLLAPFASAPLLAGGSEEGALLVVDPKSPEALYVANYYRAARDVPAANLLYMDPAAPNYPTWVSDNQAGFLGHLAGRRLEHVDCVVVMPGTTFYVSAPGLVSDGCSPVNRFTIAAPFALAFNSGAILGGTGSGRPNRYYGPDDDAVAFDSSITWWGGDPSDNADAERYFIAAQLGYLGERGNTLQEILDLIDRSVAVDGTLPVSTFYFMQTNDPLRSGPRHGFYPAVTAAIIALGGQAQHLFADLPLGHHDCQGIMTGLANPDIVNGDFTIVAGAFCDHLTSYAGTFDNSSQVKMSRWIEKGASATSGTIEEPCNYPGKFPHARMHLYYVQGLSMGEAWFRSMRYYIFQNLLYGDPLTRPFAHIPTVDVPDAPTGPVSGTILLTPIGNTTMPGAQLEDVEVYVDGVLVRTGTIGQSLPVHTATLSDGWHELRVLAYDDSTIRSAGRWVGALEVANLGATTTIGVNTTAGDLDQRFDFGVECPGSTVSELRLVQNGRVIGSTASNPGTISVYGQTLGAGPVGVQAEALFAGGARVRSAPLDLTVDFTGGGASASAPVAFDYTRFVPDDQASVIELPAAFDDSLAAASFAISSGPSQGSFAPGSTGGFRVFRPDPGASGTDSFTFDVTTPSGVSGAATVTLVFEATPGCTDPTSYCSTAPNSAGSGALIGWEGSTSVLANDLGLTALGAAPLQFGIFYYGPEQIQQPFGEGFRCVGGGALGLFRLPVLMTDGFGDAEYALDLNQPPANAGAGEILAGSTWNAQFWYRDPQGGGTGFNLSDGLNLVFCP